MPRGQPFTALCRSSARRVVHGCADLHVHSTFSDGVYTPAEIVSLARRSGLAAVAVTDHDTLDGVAPALAAARGTDLEVIPALEITAEHDSRELHLLGYFVRTDDGPLQAALERLRAHRAGRFWEMVERLRGAGVSFAQEELASHARSGSLGRRHLAALLVQSGRAHNVQEAFARYLSDRGRVAAPKLRLPAGEAIALIVNAGGVAAWAHPAYHGTKERLAELRALGLQAVEVAYPGHRPALERELRRHAAELGLAVTGGSDCHGPGVPRRAIGASGVNAEELERLRSLAGGPPVRRCSLNPEPTTTAQPSPLAPI